MHWAEYVLLIFMGFLTLAILLGTLASFLTPPTRGISNYESDAHTCYQLRKQGWTEKEIEDFMNKYGSYYVKEDEDETLRTSKRP